jgi:hypothetical protein
MDTINMNEPPVSGGKKGNRPWQSQSRTQKGRSHNGGRGDGRSPRSDDIGIWWAVEPDISAEIAALAGASDPEETVRAVAASSFDAANSTVEGSPELEAAYRQAAKDEHRRYERIIKERDGQAETFTVETAERDLKPNGWQLFWGWVALVMLAALMVPIPLVVAQGIAQSYAMDAISDDWRLGLPVGLPVLGGIIASGLFRHTLTHGARNVYDRVMSVVGLGALAGWAGGFAYTFLAPFDASGIFGSEGGTGLQGFYALHLGVEVTAALGLTAMVERSFSAGRKIVNVLNEGVDLLTDRAGLFMGRWLDFLRKAETVRDRHARLAAARDAYILKCLAHLHQAQARRNAAMASAAADFGDITHH